jgi:hypothetical protein
MIVKRIKHKDDLLSYLNYIILLLCCMYMVNMAKNILHLYSVDGKKIATNWN